MSATKVLIPDSRLKFHPTSGGADVDRQEGLSPSAVATAVTELNETPAGKEQALAIFRDWVLKHPQLINVRVDDNFLLRFLRVRKYNVPMAEHNLVKYLNFRQSIPDFCFDLDYTKGTVAELIDSGYMFASPFRDAHGRRVVIAIAEKFDTNKFTRVDMAKVHAITYETLLEDEENQIMGLTHLGDLKGISMAHVALWPPLELAICLRIGEQAVPLRHKAVHVFNFSSPFKFIADFAVSRVSQKIKNRLMIHDSPEDLYNHLDRKCLPKEYGGVVPLADMIGMWKKELAASRTRLLALDNMKSLVPIKRRTNAEEVTGSFKKLEVD